MCPRDYFAFVRKSLLTTHGHSVVVQLVCECLQLLLLASVSYADGGFSRDFVLLDERLFQHTFIKYSHCDLDRKLVSLWGRMTTKLMISWYKYDRHRCDLPWCAAASLSVHYYFCFDGLGPWSFRRGRLCYSVRSPAVYLCQASSSCVVLSINCYYVRGGWCLALSSSWTASSYHPIAMSTMVMLVCCGPWCAPVWLCTNSYVIHSYTDTFNHYSYLQLTALYYFSITSCCSLSLWKVPTNTQTAPADTHTI